MTVPPIYPDDTVIVTVEQRFQLRRVEPDVWPQSRGRGWQFQMWRPAQASCGIRDRWPYLESISWYAEAQNVNPAEGPPVTLLIAGTTSLSLSDGNDFVPFQNLPDLSLGLATRINPAVLTALIGDDFRGVDSVPLRDCYCGGTPFPAHTGRPNEPAHLAMWVTVAPGFEPDPPAPMVLGVVRAVVSLRPNRKAVST